MEEQEICKIACETVTTIKPFLLSGTQAMVNAAAADLWKSIKSIFKKNKQEQLLEAFERNPQDEKTTGKIEYILENELSQNRDLLSTFTELIKSVHASREYKNYVLQEGNDNISISGTTNSSVNITKNNISNPQSSIQNQVINNYLVAENRKLCYFRGDTKPEYDGERNLYETMYVFGSETFDSLNNIEINISFNAPYEEIKWTTYGGKGAGMVWEDNPEYNEDASKTSFNYKRSFLYPNNYIVLKVYSKNILDITNLIMKPS